MADIRALAGAVAARRHRLGLTQAQLAKRGGPSTETMRLIENAMRESYGSRTLAQLENVLQWKPGTAEAILRGRVADDPDSWAEPERDENGDVRFVTMYQMLDGEERTFEAPITAVATHERAGWRRVERGEDDEGPSERFTSPRMSGPTAGENLELGGEAGVRGALSGVLDALRPAGMQANAMKSVRLAFDVGAGSAMRAFTQDIVPVLPGLSAALSEAAGPSPAALAIGSIMDSLKLDEPPWKSALAGMAGIAIPPIDITPLLGLNRIAAFAVATVHPDVLQAMKEFEGLHAEIEKQPWFDEDAPWRHLLARYRYEQEHGPIDDDEPVDEEPKPAPGGILDEPRAEDTATTTVIPASQYAAVVEYLEPTEILPPQWSFLVTAQEDLADVDTLSVANELYERVRHRRPSPARDEQMRAVHALIGELFEESQGHPAPQRGLRRLMR